jgi:hypothetical protein
VKTSGLKLCIDITGFILDPLERQLPRSFCRCSECRFRESLLLPGWDQRSVWGFDGTRRSFFAQLRPNGSKPKMQPVFLPSGWHIYWWPAVLALDLVAVTEMTPIAVCTALQLVDPNASLRPADAIEAELESPPPGVTDEYHHGYRRALLWVLGAENTCPGSGLESRGRPTPLSVNAESELLSGRCYSQEPELVLDQQSAAGGEAALDWALGGRNRRTALEQR